MATDGSAHGRLVANYERHFDEHARLQMRSGQLERDRTRQLLAARLKPPPSRIADIGGGTGAHADWLALEGHDVTLVDLTPSHVTAAAARAGGLATPFDTHVADARCLGFPDAVFDAVLLLGPVYHLTTRDDRLRALAEAVRVAKPGGLVAAAAISRFAGVLDTMRQAKLTGSTAQRFASTWLATGVAQFPCGADVYFHRPKELQQELLDVGLRDLQVHGLEGPGWMLIDDDTSDDLYNSALAAASLIGDDQTTSERATIQAAADRLLAGNPLRSTGELTIVQLAIEASVKRWMLTHKHRDLAHDFQARVRALGGDPPPVQALKQQTSRLEPPRIPSRRFIPNLDAQVERLTSAFGMAVRFHSEHFALVVDPGSGFKLELSGSDDGEVHLRHLGFRADDVDTAHAGLLAAGNGDHFGTAWTGLRRHVHILSQGTRRRRRAAREVRLTVRVGWGLRSAGLTQRLTGFVSFKGFVGWQDAGPTVHQLVVDVT